jgi:acetolactate synthase regulatory subunit
MTPQSTLPATSSSGAVAPRPGAVAPRPHARSVLTIEVVDAPDVLVRVLTTLRSRRCTITHVEYLAPDRHRPGHLVVVIEPPRAHAHCVDAWLLNLVDVVSVGVAPSL